MPEYGSKTSNNILRAMIVDAFDQDALKRVCEMHEDEFAEHYGLNQVQVAQRYPADFYLYKDNGSNILAVAHLDTVGLHAEREARFVDTEDGLVIFSRALDDRLGAYIILELLPKLNINYDILLTVGEEDGMSTAQFFEPDEDKQYDWMIEFDRGGTDVVTYDYEDEDLVDKVIYSGAKHGIGAFSDISYLEHVGVKALNWGVGYRDYHGPRAHAFLEDTFLMLARYLRFYAANKDVHMPHCPMPKQKWWNYRDHDTFEAWDARLGGGGSTTILDVGEPKAIESKQDPECYRIFGDHEHDDECEQILADLKGEGEPDEPLRSFN